MILWRNESICVVNKPAGIATHRGWDGARDALLQRVRDLLGCYVYPVNRLDRGASGAILFALTREAASALGIALAAGAIDKTYLAITRGHPANGTIDYAIPKAPDEPRVDAVTDIACLETFGRYALVEARPRTGRLHQIRRHLKHVSCPLIGDVRYGKGEHNRIFRDQHNLHRLALHCSALDFPLPNDTRQRVDAPLADDMAAALVSCRNAYSTSGTQSLES